MQEAHVNELLIEVVKSKPQLWNMRDKLYRNSDLTARNWEEVAEIVGIDAVSAKKRWRSLRDRFVREGRNMARPKGSGAKRETQWNHLESLMFLKPTVTPRTTITNFRNTMTLTDLAGMEEDEILTEVTIEGYNDHQNNDSESLTADDHLMQPVLTEHAIGTPTSMSSQPQVRPGPSSSSKSQSLLSSSKQDSMPMFSRMGQAIKRKRTNKEDDLERAIIERLDTSQQKDYTQNELFFLSIGKTIDEANFSLSSQLYVKFKTLEALREASEKDGTVSTLNFSQIILIVSKHFVQIAS